MLATLGDIDAFTGGDDWAYEMKWDGYRAIATITGSATVVSFRSRNGLDMTATYPGARRAASTPSTATPSSTARSSRSTTRDARASSACSSAQG